MRDTGSSNISILKARAPRATSTEVGQCSLVQDNSRASMALQFIQSIHVREEKNGQMVSTFQCSADYLRSIGRDFTVDIENRPEGFYGIFVTFTKTRQFAFFFDFDTMVIGKLRGKQATVLPVPLQVNFATPETNGSVSVNGVRLRVEWHGKMELVQQPSQNTLVTRLGRAAGDDGKAFLEALDREITKWLDANDHMMAQNNGAVPPVVLTRQSLPEEEEDITVTLRRLACAILLKHPDLSRSLIFVSAKNKPAIGDLPEIRVRLPEMGPILRQLKLSQTIACMIRSGEIGPPKGDFGRLRILPTGEAPRRRDTTSVTIILHKHEAHDDLSPGEQQACLAEFGDLIDAHVKARKSPADGYRNT